VTWQPSKPWLLIASAFVLACCSRPLPVRSIDGGRYGQVKLIEPVHPQAVVIFFTDQNGTTSASNVAADRLARTGALVVEVNTPSYLKRLSHVDEKCHYLAGDAEGLAHQLERSLRFPHYLTPILAGPGVGGGIAELALAQAPAVTIAGAVSVDPSTRLLTTAPMCPASGAGSSAGDFSHGTRGSMPGYWTVGLTPNAPSGSREYFSALRRAGTAVDIHQLADETLGEDLAGLIVLHYSKAKPARDLATLPLIPLPVNHPSKLMAVLLSGDGGWRDLDKTIAEQLQRQGIPVVGWDSLRYFWTGRTPQQTSDDLSRVIQAYMVKWRATDVALIGYSFGADVLPFAYHRLSPDLRSHVKLLALLAFASSADFQVRVGGWLGLPPSPDALPVMPAMDDIPAGLVQCFYGENEHDSACPALVKRGAEVIRTAGGHHFDGDYTTLEHTILAGFERRVSQRVGSTAARHHSS
jgi:type IV secretory pathway VirJ component